jgi:ABC-type cobalamin transport system permease subunit
MAAPSHRMRQLMDWRAALWAGVIAGVIFLLLNLFLVSGLVGSSPWVLIRLMASALLGPGIQAPPATFDLGALVAALVTHFVLSIGFALLVAFALHRWGLVVGILGGALFGLALYFFNFYTLTYFFPWFFTFRGWPLLLTHVVFGATAGGVYELLEVEEWTPA